MPHKQKLRPEEKVKIVRRYLAGEVSISGAAEEFGVGHTSVQEWIVQYKAEGIAAFLPHKRNRKYSPELNLQAVQDYLSGGGSLLKRERYYGRRFTSKRELTQMIQHYIHYYNTRRVQRNLGILTPMEKHALYLAA